MLCAVGVNVKVRGFALLLAAASGICSAQIRGTLISINGRVPLGIEAFRLEPAKRDFYMMASAENPSFVGLRRVTDRQGDKLIMPGGKALTHYPEKVQFRLTASSREKILEEKPFATESNLSLEDLLKQLRFRLKIFHGLEYRYVQPAFVEDVGMPRDLPYDERIYRIGFAIGHVPIEDRVVMEVLSPNGDRLCKFHLDIL